MSIADLKARLRDVPGIETLTMQTLLGRDVYGFAGQIAGVDPKATGQEIEDAIRTAAARAAEPAPAAPAPAATPLPIVNLTEAKPMTTTPSPTGFAASLKAMIDEARAGVAQARTDGLAKVSDAVGKMNQAKAATAKVAGTMASAIEDETASVLAELGQISNDLGV